MSIMSDIWIEQQCLDPVPALIKRADFLREQLPKVKSQPNVHLAFSDELEAIVWKLDQHKKSNWKPMIEPFIGEVVREQDGKKLLSYGLSSYSYDVRLAPKFKLFTNVFAGSIDPKQLDPKCYVEVEEDVVYIPPNGYLLGHTVENFRIPRNVSALCCGKSTYARAGLMVNTTVIDAGFEGQIVLEAANCTNLPLKVYAGEGFAQLLFFTGDQACRVSYADRKGKYMHQTQIQDSKV